MSGGCLATLRAAVSRRPPKKPADLLEATRRRRERREYVEGKDKRCAVWGWIARVHHMARTQSGCLLGGFVRLEQYGEILLFYLIVF